MTATLDAVAFDCTDPAGLAGFWAGVLRPQVPEGKEFDVIADGEQ